MPPLYMENKVHVPYQTLQNFYSSKSFVDKLLQYWKESDSKRPKFSYLAMTAPHCTPCGRKSGILRMLNCCCFHSTGPLQAPEEDIAKYKGVYDDGPEALREQRLKKMAELGLVDPEKKPAPLVATFGTKRWSDLTELERKESAKKMEVYAAMIEGLSRGTLWDQDVV